MSDKRLRPPVATRTASRVALGLAIGAVITVLVVVVTRRVTDDSSSPTSAVAAGPTASTLPAPRLAGSYEVTLDVVAIDYGATWPASSPRLSAGQRLVQRWSVECRGTSCAISVTGNHIAEDMNGATVTSTDAKTFQVSGTSPGRADASGQPAGCGTVNAIDRQQLTLVQTDDVLSGTYLVHHPTIHIEGPVGDLLGSCDSFNLAFNLTGRRVP
ncbi:MAG: hypothetical protein QOG39_250 [Acidimicrobiaceae bacterium]